MLATVIVPTYKDVGALALIMEALEQQTWRNFEVIIAEDDNADATREFVSSLKVSFPVTHFSHEDFGTIRKAKAVNSAVRLSKGEYLIYIDGDTIPFSTFVEAHVRLATPRTVLCGRRVNLGEKVSTDLRAGRVKALDLEHAYLRHYFYLNRDNIRHYGQGLYFKPNSALQRLLAHFDDNIHILASNFSCFKEDMLAINGSDEDIPGGPGVDDTDVEWRIKAHGVTLKSCKYCANLFHLNHPRSDRKDAFEKNLEIIRQKKTREEIVCRNGIRKL